MRQQQNHSSAQNYSNTPLHQSYSKGWLKAQEVFTQMFDEHYPLFQPKKKRQ
jgi:hypothetical protein